MGQDSHQNPVKQEETGRNPDGTFKDGVSGNPNGRPKGLSITQMVRDALEEVEPKTGITWKDLIIIKIILKAVAEGDTNLIKTIWAYIDGMPVQPNAEIPDDRIDEFLHIYKPEENKE